VNAGQPPLLTVAVAKSIKTAAQTAHDWQRMAQKLGVQNPHHDIYLMTLIDISKVIKESKQLRELFNEPQEFAREGAAYLDKLPKGAEVYPKAWKIGYYLYEICAQLEAPKQQKDAANYDLMLRGIDLVGRFERFDTQQGNQAALIEQLKGLRATVEEQKRALSN
jgi:hypothetical protein